MIIWCGLVWCRRRRRFPAAAEGGARERIEEGVCEGF